MIVVGRGFRTRAARMRQALRVVVAMVCLWAVGFGSMVASAQQAAWSQRLANQTMERWPKGRFVGTGSTWSWNYQLGLLLEGIGAVWSKTGDPKYFAYTKDSIDQLIAIDGTIPTYDPRENSLDNILLGRQLLLLYRMTREERYHAAAKLLRAQLRTQPRNASGGFWHTQSNPNQMLLDDAYMVAPFLAEYAAMFNEPADYRDITKQFALMEEHTRDAKSGLLYQEWNEPRTEPWVSRSTGTSASFWGRGTGWYLMALVDALPYYAKDDPGRATLLGILNRTAESVARHQDGPTGLWYQVLDKPAMKGNYLESSASGMFVYALAKGVRLGYLPKRYSTNASKGWSGMLEHFVKTGGEGQMTIVATVKSIDLGSAPSHDGSYAYYINAPVVSDDPKGIAAFLLASSEMNLVSITRSSRPDVSGHAKPDHKRGQIIAI